MPPLLTDRQGCDLGFPIGQKNTNLVEDVEIGRGRLFNVYSKSLSFPWAKINFKGFITKDLQFLGPKLISMVLTQSNSMFTSSEPRWIILIFSDFLNYIISSFLIS